MKKFVLFFGLLFSVLCACSQKPDVVYVGEKNAPTVAALRTLFRETFRYACTMEEKGQGKQSFLKLIGPHEPEPQLWAGTDAHREEEHSRGLNAVLAERDRLRVSVTLTPEQRENLSGEIHCLLVDTWGCQQWPSSSNYGIHCPRVTPN